MIKNNFDYETERNRILRARNRTKLFIRLWEGIKKVVLPPFIGIIPLVVVMSLFYIAYKNRFLPCDEYISKQFYNVYDGIKVLGLILITLVFLFVLVICIGIPLRARSDEDSLMVAFKIREFSHARCPILISRKHGKNGVLRREFYSKWIEKADWEKFKTAIEDVLNCRIVEPIEYGGRNNNNRRRIVIYTMHGFKPTEREAIQDPLFKE